jgi:predicted dehydrogenase
VTAPDHVTISGRFANGAIASVFYRGGVSRGNNFRWEINGGERDLVLTSATGNMQVIRICASLRLRQLVPPRRLSNGLVNPSSSSRK